MDIQIVIAFIFGVIFIVTLIVLATKFPHPTPFQDRIFRIVLALAAAGVAVMIPGFINLELTIAMSLIIRSGGAIAMFVIVYFFTPALMSKTEDKEKDKGIAVDENLPDVQVKENPVSSIVIYAIVHEKGNKARCLPDADVTLILNEPIVKRTAANGTAIFIIPKQNIGQKFIVNASKVGYEERKPITFSLSEETQVFIPLDPAALSPNTSSPRHNGEQTEITKENNIPNKVKTDNNSHITPPLHHHGAMWLEDKRYIPRITDTMALERAKGLGETLVILAASKMGKTSLLIRYLEECKNNGKLTCQINLSELSQYFNNFSALLRNLAELLINEFNIECNGVDNIDSPVKLRSFIEKEVFSKVQHPIVVAIDDADMILGESYQTDFFYMFRSWHNMRANHSGWQKVDIVLVISVNPTVLIQDDHLSPFNVTAPIILKPFTLEQAQILNQAHDNFFTSEQLSSLWELVQGHPYLLHLLFLQIEDQNNQIADYSSLMKNILEKDGVFSDHLNGVLKRFQLDSEYDLKQTMCKICSDQDCSDANAINRLLAMGLIRLREGKWVPANDMYRNYFKDLS